MLDIRHYTDSDYETVASWFLSRGEQAPKRNQLPAESTFLCCLSGLPILSVSLILTNIDTAWIEFFIGNPDNPGHVRRTGTKLLLDFLKTFAQESGYSQLFCMSPNENLRKYYKELGFTETLSGLTAFRMEV